MIRVLILTKDTKGMRELHSGLVRMGFACSVVNNSADLSSETVKQACDVLLIALNGSSTFTRTKSLQERLHELRTTKNLRAIALVSDRELDSLASKLEIDDFVVKPWKPNEVAARVKRLIKRSSNVGGDDLIKYGDLVIDIAKCEVSINGRLLALTFKEYELLKFLAKNRGRVFTREELLNKVWGYDYYGGDRTVDVHIRRLRSKLNDCTGNYIHTVRNIGYKFNWRM